MEIKKLESFSAELFERLKFRARHHKKLKIFVAGFERPRSRLMCSMNHLTAQLFTFSRDSTHAYLSATELVLLQLFDFAALVDADHGKAHVLENRR